MHNICKVGHFFIEIIIGVCFNVECKLNTPNLPDALAILGCGPSFTTDAGR